MGSDLEDIQMAANGEIPKRDRYYRGYSRFDGESGFIGTWLIQVARTIASQLRQHGWKVSVRGRGWDRTLCNSLGIDVRYWENPPLEYALEGLVYITGRRKR